MKNAIFVFCIFVAITFTYSNTMRAIKNLQVNGMNIIIMSAALTGIITHCIGIW